MAGPLGEITQKRSADAALPLERWTLKLYPSISSLSFPSFPLLHAPFHSFSLQVTLVLLPELKY